MRQPALSGVGQGIPGRSLVVEGPAGAVQDMAVGAAYSSFTGAEAAPITGITGAAAEAGGEAVVGTAAEDFAAGVGLVKFGFDVAVGLYGYFGACHQ